MKSLVVIGIAICLAETFLVIGLVWLIEKLFRWQWLNRPWLHLSMSFPGTFVFAQGWIGFAFPVPMLFGLPILLLSALANANIASWVPSPYFSYIEFAFKATTNADLSRLTPYLLYEAGCILAWGLAHALFAHRRNGLRSQVATLADGRWPRLVHVTALLLLPLLVVFSLVGARMSTSASEQASNSNGELALIGDRRSNLGCSNLKGAQERAKVRFERERNTVQKQLKLGLVPKRSKSFDDLLAEEGCPMDRGPEPIAEFVARVDAEYDQLATETARHQKRATLWQIARKAAGISALYVLIGYLCFLVRGLVHALRLQSR